MSSILLVVVDLFKGVILLLHVVSIFIVPVLLLMSLAMVLLFLSLIFFLHIQKSDTHSKIYRIFKKNKNKKILC